MALTNFPHLKSARSALLCSALAVPALAPVAVVAQDQAEPCSQLEQAADQINFDESEISEEEFARVVEANDPQQCETWLTQVAAETTVTETERARVQLQDEVVIEGRVIVDQPQPKVQIEEQAAEVTVGKTTPDVNVTEGQMDILIRQGAPRISVDIPQPTITIEQPAPEIIVTMPDPSVEVGNTRPQIEVRQAEPRVQVSSAEPTVELDLYQAEDPENSPGIAVEQRQREAGSDGASAEPQVDITRSEAEIIYQETEQQANVKVSRSEPSIRMEQSEPEIEVARSGEPQVNWSQSGEAKVTFRESSDADPDAQENREASDQAENERTAAASGERASEETSSTGTQRAENAQAQAGGPAVRREGYAGVSVDQVEATELDGATVYGVQGDEIGEIGRLTIADEEAQAIIVDVGSLLGNGEHQVEIPFSDLTLLRGEDEGDIRVYIDASEEQLKSYPEAG